MSNETPPTEHCGSGTYTYECKDKDCWYCYYIGKIATEDDYEEIAEEVYKFEEIHKPTYYSKTLKRSKKVIPQIRPHKIKTYINRFTLIEHK